MNSLSSKLSNRVNQLYQIGRIEMWRKSPEQKYGRYAGFEAGIWSRFWIGSQICLNFWARTKIDRDSDILHYFSKEGIFEGRKSNFDSLYRSVNVKKEKRKGKEFSKKKMCPAWQTKWMKYQVIGNQIKEEKFEICIKSVYRYERRKGRKEKLVKSHHFCQFWVISSKSKSNSTNFLPR